MYILTGAVWKQCVDLCFLPPKNASYFSPGRRERECRVRGGTQRAAHEAGREIAPYCYLVGFIPCTYGGERRGEASNPGAKREGAASVTSAWGSFTDSTDCGLSQSLLALVSGKCWLLPQAGTPAHT